MITLSHGLYALLCVAADVIRIDKTDENFRLMYDVKGRYTLHRIEKEEAQYKLCRVQKLSKAKKGTIGRNPLAVGQAATIPYIVTHDGRTIRYPDPLIKVNDTIKLDLETGKIVGHIKFDVGNLCMVTRGHNMGECGCWGLSCELVRRDCGSTGGSTPRTAYPRTAPAHVASPHLTGHLHSRLFLFARAGRIGVMTQKERHPGSFDIVHIKDKKGNPFTTRLQNVFVIGHGNSPSISLPKGNGIKLTISEERDANKKKN